MHISECNNIAWLEKFAVKLAVLDLSIIIKTHIYTKMSYLT